MANLEEYEREHLVIEYESSYEENPTKEIFKALKSENAEPLIIEGYHNTLGHCGRNVFLFDRDVQCPSPEKLEKILGSINFSGAAIIRKLNTADSKIIEAEKKIVIIYQNFFHKGKPAQP